MRELCSLPVKWPQCIRGKYVFAAVSSFRAEAYAPSRSKTLMFCRCWRAATVSTWSRITWSRPLIAEDFVELATAVVRCTAQRLRLEVGGRRRRRRRRERERERYGRSLFACFVFAVICRRQAEPGRVRCRLRLPLRFGVPGCVRLAI